MLHMFNFEDSGKNHEIGKPSSGLFSLLVATCQIQLLLGILRNIHLHQIRYTSFCTAAQTPANRKQNFTAAVSVERDNGSVFNQLKLASSSWSRATPELI